MTKSIVLYHGFCSDGFGAAWAASKFLDPETTEFVECVYGDPAIEIERVRDKDVYLLDFCYPKAKLLEIAEASQNTFLLDHHKTAKEMLQIGSDNNACVPRLHPKLFVTFDMLRSGCQITWDWFVTGLLLSSKVEDQKKLDELQQLTHTRTKINWATQPRPPVIDYVGDRDLWAWKLENSREINEAINSYEREFELWDLLNTKIGEGYLTEEGKAILRATSKQVKDTCEIAYFRQYVDETGGTEKVAVCNTFTNVSDVGSALRDSPVSEDKRVRMSVIWFRLPDGKFKLSFRSTKEYDCSKVAQRYGGGGHKEAAGALVDKLPEWLL